MSFIGGPLPKYEINRRNNRPNYGKNDGNLFSDFLDIFKNKKDTKDTRSEIEKITGITYQDMMKMQRDRENELINQQALMGGINDAGQYAYLGGRAQTEAAKNIGRNTQDMLRSMAYGQAAMSKALAGASNLKALDRKYFS
tara:strand:+ start:2454 stop:2876 length:423 start_codon:yes stop_codon:yes gene_type:complete